MEVRGKVTSIDQATATAPGAITLDVMGLAVSCVIPAGAAVDVQAGTMIELECEAVGTPAVWTVRVAHDEDEQVAEQGDGADQSSAEDEAGDDDGGSASQGDEDRNDEQGDDEQDGGDE
jgi:hypothetical protein